MDTLKIQQCAGNDKGYTTKNGTRMTRYQVTGDDADILAYTSAKEIPNEKGEVFPAIVDTKWGLIHLTPNFVGIEAEMLVKDNGEIIVFNPELSEAKKSAHIARLYKKNAENNKAGIIDAQLSIALDAFERPFLTNGNYAKPISAPTATPVVDPNLGA